MLKKSIRAQAPKLVPDTILKSKSGRINRLYRKAMTEVDVHIAYEDTLALGF